MVHWTVFHSPDWIFVSFGSFLYIDDATRADLQLITASSATAFRLDVRRCYAA